MLRCGLEHWPRVLVVAGRHDGPLVLLMCCDRPVGAVTLPGKVFEGRDHPVHPGTPGQESVCWQVNVAVGSNRMFTMHQVICKELCKHFIQLYVKTIRRAVDIPFYR